MHDFQNRGEAVRRQYGIDGTAGDAQDHPHSHTPDTGYGDWCVACGLAPGASVHRRGTDG
jgi:hypothetical protein